MIIKIKIIIILIIGKMVCTQRKCSVQIEAPLISYVGYSIAWFVFCCLIG